MVKFNLIKMPAGKIAGLIVLLCYLCTGAKAQCIPAHDTICVGNTDTVVISSSCNPAHAGSWGSSTPTIVSVTSIELSLFTTIIDSKEVTASTLSRMSEASTGCDPGNRTAREIARNVKNNLMVIYILLSVYLCILMYP